MGFTLLKNEKSMNLLESNRILTLEMILIICIGLIVFMIMIQSAHAGEECASLGGGCDNSGWDPMQKLDEIGAVKEDQPQASAKWPEKSRMMRWNKSAYGFDDAGLDASKEGLQKEALSIEGTDQQDTKNKKILMPIEEVSSKDILLDVSENSSKHIEGAVVIPYMEFSSRPGALKPVSEVARILGDAGISRDDPVVIYGECLPCGGGPAPATYVYWVVKQLGHENVWVLNGTAEDWAAAGKKVSADVQTRQRKDYVPEISAGYTATYRYVKSGQAQIVDARTPQEYESGSIPGSINIPYDGILNNKKIAGEAALKETFASLSVDRPVVVYTDTGIKGSVVWFALEMMGYDVRLYTWQDWLANQRTKGNASG